MSGCAPPACGPPRLVPAPSTRPRQHAPPSTDRIGLWFDPLGPWGLVASKLVNQLVELGEVEVTDWRLFSLELINGGEETLEAATEFRSSRALRTAVAVRAAAGADGV